MNRSTKFLLSIFCLSATGIVIVILYAIPTDSFRNIFFFADLIVFKEISSTGHIKPITRLISNDGVSVLQYYPKISHRSRVPLYGIWLVIFEQVAGLSPKTIYSQFPGFLFTFAAFAVVSHRLTQSRSISIVIGIVGMFAPTLQPIYSLNFNSIITVMFLGGIYAMLCYVDGISKRQQLIAIILYSTSVLSLFYWYPPRAMILTAVATFISFILIIFHRRSRNPLSLAFASIVTFGFSIFALPLPSFLDLFTAISETVLSGDVPIPSLVASNSGTTTKGLSTAGYAWIPVLPLLIVGAIGGIVCFYDIFFDEQPNTESIIMIAWGVAIISVIGAYLMTGQSWLSGRALGLAEFVIIFGSAIGLRWIKQQEQKMVITVTIVILLLTAPAAYTLRATGPVSSIQTYQVESDDFASWGATHLDGVALGSQKTGAILVANGFKSYRYPQTLDGMNATFYPKNKNEHINTICDLGADYVILTKQEQEVGVYVMSRPRIPMNSDTMFQHSQDSIYTDGEYKVQSTHNIC